MSSRRSNQLSYMPMSCRTDPARTDQYKGPAARFPQSEFRALCLLQNLDRLVERGVGRRWKLVEANHRYLDADGGSQPFLVNRAGAINRQVTLVGHPQTVVLRQPYQPLSPCDPCRRLADELGAIVTDQ